MLRWWWIVGCFFLGNALLAESPDWIGLTPEEVRERLGSPRGEIGDGDFVLWTYDAGDLVFRAGRVARADLRDPAEAARAREIYEERQRSLQESRLRAAAERQAEGEKAWAELRQSARFTEASAAQRLVLMQGFRSVYPTVDLGLEWALAFAEEDDRLARERARARAEQNRLAAASPVPEQGLRVSRTIGSGYPYPPPAWPGFTGGSTTVIVNGQVVSPPPHFFCPWTAHRRPLLTVRF